MPRKRESRVYTRGPRYWGDFRDYGDVGGGREPLVPDGVKLATTDADIAGELAAARVRELAERRRAKGLFGIEAPRSLDEFSAHYLKVRADQTGDDRVTDGTLAEYEHMLGRAVDFFGAERELTTIRPKEVNEWSRHLAKRKTGRGGRCMSGGTVRHHLNTLSSLYRYAQQDEAVPPGYNPVAALVKKPTAKKVEADWLEVHEAALLLEAAQLYTPERKWAIGYAGPKDDPNPEVHAIVGTLLLTGGRWSEVAGLDVDDVGLDRRTVTFRPNAHRRLKTSTSHRVVPLWPQLEEILRAWIFGGSSPRSGGLLFPSRSGGMVRDLRKALDHIGTAAGWGKGELRTKMLRHTFCAAALQLVDRGAPVSPWTVAKWMGHGGQALVDRVYGHLGEVRQRTEVVEFRVDQYREKLGERLKALTAR